MMMVMLMMQEGGNSRLAVGFAPPRDSATLPQFGLNLLIIIVMMMFVRRWGMIVMIMAMVIRMVVMVILVVVVMVMGCWR